MTRPHRYDDDRVDTFDFNERLAEATVTAGEWSPVCLTPVLIAEEFRRSRVPQAPGGDRSEAEPGDSRDHVVVSCQERPIDRRAHG
jgi:hypothetical protein